MFAVELMDIVTCVWLELTDAVRGDSGSYGGCVGVWCAVICRREGELRTGQALTVLPLSPFLMQQQCCMQTGEVSHSAALKSKGIMSSWTPSIKLAGSFLTF
jgi:hypothetical protein